MNKPTPTPAQNMPASFDILALTGRAFDIACTLQTLRATMPEDQQDAAIPTTYMVAMLARQATELADALFELPFVLVEPSKAGG